MLKELGTELSELDAAVAALKEAIYNSDTHIEKAPRTWSEIVRCAASTINFLSRENKRLAKYILERPKI